MVCQFVTSVKILLSKVTGGIGCHGTSSYDLTPSSRGHPGADCVSGRLRGQAGGVLHGEDLQPDQGQGDEADLERGGRLRSREASAQGGGNI